jgi:23S rRNA pseudouridine1911/1915/1917 synthase
VIEAVPAALEGERVDRLVAMLGDVSRADAVRLLEAGAVRIDGEVVRAGKQRVHEGQVLELDDDHVLDRVAVASDPSVSVDVVHADADVIVVDKPAGLVVHPAPGHATGTLVHGLLAHVDDLAGIGGELRPGIVHRLDKDTTGVMVVAKDEPTQTALSAAFKAKTDVVREYIAVAAPAPPGARGTIRTLYDRHPVDRKKFTSKVARGKPAVTHWEVVERLALGAALVTCRLETGRTHQIRVHMSDSGWPLVGDQLYGRRYSGELAELSRTLGRQALHAARLELVHPITGARLAFTTEPPADFVALLTALRTSTDHS